MTVALADAARAAGVAVLRGNAPEERRVAGAGGLALHILDWGPAGGADVLMLHGFGQTAHTWDLCCAGLGAHLRLLSLDLRGHGESAWMADGTYDLDDVVFDTLAVVDRLATGAVVLVGASLGGLVAIRAGRRLGRGLAGLVLVDAAVSPAPTGARGIRQFLADVPAASFDAHLARARAFNPTRPEVLLRRSLEHSLRPNADGTWARRQDPRWSDRSRRRGWSAELLLSELAALDAPALVVRGADSDVLDGQAADEMVAVLAAGELAVVPDAGHAVPGDQPAELARAMTRFFDERVGGRWRSDTAP